MAIHCKTVEQHFTGELFVVQFHTACNFGKFINFGLDTVRMKRVRMTVSMQSIMHNFNPRDVTNKDTVVSYLLS